MQPTNPSQTLDLIRHVLPLLLLSCLTVKSFAGRWQLLRSKLLHLKNSLSEISDSPHWSQNPLLQELLPNLLTTLEKTKTLSDQCHDSSYTGGKLLMQSDLDMAASSISLHLHDLDLLIKSGVLRQSNAIVLSQPGPGSSKDELGFFIRDLFARLQIGGIEFKKKALDSLLQLLQEDEKNSVLVAKEGDVGYLIHLLDLNTHSVVREQAVVAVSILAAAAESSRKSLFEEGGLGPLLRLLEMGSSAVKEKAATAIEAITSDPENAWAVSAYGGVLALIDACQSGSPATQVFAAGALKNIAVVEDTRRTMAEEGAIKVLIELLNSGTAPAQENAAQCIRVLASSGEEFRVFIVREDGLRRLLQLIQEVSNPDTIEHVLKAIYALSASISTSRALSCSAGFISQLAELVKHGNANVQQISASLICNLSLNDGSKRAIAGSMGTLVKMLESSKPVALQEISARALVNLLSVRSNRKDFVKDEKSLLRLVQMLDPNNEGVCKKFPLLVASVLSSGSSNCRKKIAAAGACPYLQKLADMDVAGAKKVLQRITGNRLKKIFTRNWRD